MRAVVQKQSIASIRGKLTERHLDALFGVEANCRVILCCLFSEVHRTRVAFGTYDVFY